MTEPIAVRWSDDDNAFVATCKAFPTLSGVVVRGKDAISELREAIEMAYVSLPDDIVEAN